MSDSSKAITVIAAMIVIPFMIVFYSMQIMFKALFWMFESFMYFALGFLGGTARGIKRWKV